MKRRVCLLAVFFACAAVSFAQQQPPATTSAASPRYANPPNAPPNPNYEITKFGQLPAGMSWDVMNSIAYDPNGKGSILAIAVDAVPPDPPVWVFDLNGKFQRSWGAGLFRRAHSVNVDRFGFIWITDNFDNLVGKFSEDGKLLMMLGKKGVAGDNTSHDAFDGLSDVVVAPSGDIFITDGYRNSRVVHFTKDGQFVNIIGGKKGPGIGEFNLPHKIVLDSKGELVIADRSNKRIVFYSQDGEFIKQWADLDLLGPSGLVILPDDTLYISDTLGQSIKIVKDDKVLDAIGGLEGSSAHQLTMDATGALYISCGTDRMIKKIVKKTRP